MYIVHTIPRFPYLGGDTIVGGAASSLLNLAKEQAKEHKVAILGNMLYEQVEHSPQVELHHLDIAYGASTIFFGIEYGFKAVRAFTHYPQVDIVQAHSGFSEYTWATTLVKLIRNVRAIHTFYCPLPNFGVRSIISCALVKLADKIGIERFIAISQNTAKSLEKASINPSRISIVPPAVNVDRFSRAFNREDIRAYLEISRDVPVVLYVGNRKPVKNLERVLEALRMLLPGFPDIVLIITTELRHRSDDRRTELLLGLVEQWALDSHLRWVGVTNEMPALMVAADVLVAPFLHTIGPSDYFIAALEAMATGTPVVVSAVGGMPEVVDNSRGRLVDPRDPQDIAQALAELLRDEGKRRSLGKHAQLYVRDNFSPEKVAARMQTIYSEVVNGRK
jgi:glycosyltransferase involved in cell wall biosynthesis